MARLLQPAILRRPLWVFVVSKRRLTILVSVAPGANGLVDRFCRCFAVFAFCVAVFAGYRRLDAANGTNEGLVQAGIAPLRPEISLNRPSNRIKPAKSATRRAGKRKIAEIRKTGSQRNAAHSTANHLAFPHNQDPERTNALRGLLDRKRSGATRLEEPNGSLNPRQTCPTNGE